jgi:ATP-binding cassette subfamily B protein
MEIVAADEPGQPIRAIDTIRRGISRTPVIRRGIVWTLLLSVVATVARLSVPVLVQQVLDAGRDAGGFEMDEVLTMCAYAALIVGIAIVVSPWAGFRMAKAAEQALYQLRCQAFEHVHKLTLSDHAETRRGTLVARVTSDVDALARFTDWGLLVWAQATLLVLGSFLVMAIYSWQLALLVLLTLIVMVPIVRWTQKRQLAAYSRLRTRVGETTAELAETLAGVRTVRAYGYEGAAEERLDEAIDRQYRAEIDIAKYFSVIFTISDIFAGVALSVVAIAAISQGEAWGIDVGVVIAYFFLINLMSTPLGELTEVLDQTQTAVAAWDKVLGLLDQAPSFPESDGEAELGKDAIAVEVDSVCFSYDGAFPALQDVDLAIPAGARVAVVGETGSGKSTFAKLLVRLEVPDEGEIRLDGLGLGELSPDSRRASVRLVPQDGFLFSTTVIQNVRYGRPDATKAEVEAAFSHLGLDWWLERLPEGLDTDVGPRGENLSVGERQLVALARAQLADPGLLVLDEATSAIDPDTERALSQALDRLAQGRTTVTIAHRLSTAEQADVVLVFDRARLVEHGNHEELVEHDGIYARLWAAWQGAVS